MSGRGAPQPLDAAAAEELEPVELAAWRGMLRVHTALFRALDAELVERHQLPLSSYDVLITLEAAPGRRLRMAELAASVLLSRSGMTRLVDRLERAELIVREECPNDGRGSYAVITPAGVSLLEDARATHLEGIRERFLRHFDEGELDVLAQAWERVVPGASRLGGNASWAPPT